MRGVLQPGQFVRLAGRADWGIGQVQSVDNDRVTVNFPHAGKVLVRGGASLVVVAEAGELPPADTDGAADGMTGT